MKEDMARNQMTTEMPEDRTHWHVMIRADILRSVKAEMQGNGVLKSDVEQLLSRSNGLAGAAIRLHTPTN